MSSLKKIEEALKVLGYSCSGDLVNIEITKEGLCNVSFGIKKISEDATDEGKMALCDYLDMVNPKIGEATDKEANAIPRRLWKHDPFHLDTTPLVKDEDVTVVAPIVHTPRTVIRYVFFKSRDKALNFAHKHESEFEICSTQALGKGELDLDIYKIKKNKGDNELYQKGYGWVLEFRMNGVKFGELEKEEDLKKKVKKSAGGPCIRYKE